jgi:threonine efflux protein
MIDFAAVATVFSVYVIGVVVPGPNFVAVVHKAVSGNRREALLLVAGIVTISLFWASCAILGIGMVFAIFPWLAFVVRIAGAMYLMWFGLRLLISAKKNRGQAPSQSQAPEARSPYLQGVVTNIANPKSIAFFAAVFSSATPEHVSAPTFLAMLAVVCATASLWYGTVALVLSHATFATAYRRAKRWVDCVCGGLIIALGVRQAL